MNNCIHYMYHNMLFLILSSILFFTLQLIVPMSELFLFTPISLYIHQIQYYTLQNYDYFYHKHKNNKKQITFPKGTERSETHHRCVH